MFSLLIITLFRISNEKGEKQSLTGYVHSGPYCQPITSREMIVSLIVPHLVSYEEFLLKQNTTEKENLGLLMKLRTSSNINTQKKNLFTILNLHNIPIFL